MRGRKTSRCPEIEAKLEAAFAMGATTVGACFYAGISRATYYNWANDDPDFLDRMEQLKQNPIMKALKTVMDNLEDPKIATWLLEKRHDEFKPKQVIEQGSPITHIESEYVKSAESNGKD